jgi:hypothetical protein
MELSGGEALSFAQIARESCSLGVTTVLAPTNAWYRERLDFESWWTTSTQD